MSNQTARLTTLIEVHGDFAIVRWDSPSGGHFYTVRDTTDGRDGRTWRQLRVARNQAKAAARHRAWGQNVALAALGWSK